MLSTKARGAILELQFAEACIARGGIVSFVYSDMAPYDAVVDGGGQLWRVQVKSATLREGRWLANAQPRKRGRAIPYGIGEVDCLVTKAAGSWYFFREVALLPASVSIYPGSPSCSHDKLRDAWELIGLPKQTTALV